MSTGRNMYTWQTTNLDIYIPVINPALSVQLTFSIWVKHKEIHKKDQSQPIIVGRPLKSYQECTSKKSSTYNLIFKVG